MPARYRRSEHWTLVYEGGLVVLHAGADQIYAIEDLTPAVAHEVMTWYADQDLDPAGLSAPARAVFEQLLTAGIVELGTARPIRAVSLRFVGDAEERFVQRLTVLLADRHVRIMADEPGDLLVFIRTNGRLRDIARDDYRLIAAPHLLIDLAYHHTFSLGPLVFPGDTACLSCLVGRLSTYWGDAAPPPRPAMVERDDLTAAVAALEVEKIIGGDQSLINSTVSYDFDKREIKQHRLYKLPWCPVCGHGEVAPTAGALALPWVQRR